MNPAFVRQLLFLAAALCCIAVFLGLYGLNVFALGVGIFILAHLIT